MNREKDEFWVRYALVDAIFGSEIEKQSEAWTYRQEGRVRAVLGMRSGVPHGPFQVFYPTGQVWIEGKYEDGASVYPWSVYLADGRKVS